MRRQGEIITTVVSSSTTTSSSLPPPPPPIPAGLDGKAAAKAQTLFITDYRDVTGKFQHAANLVPEIIDIPSNYGKLLQGYTMIFGVDDPTKEYTKTDQFFPYEHALVIYKAVETMAKIGRVALDMRDFNWTCGPKKLCTLDKLYANITSTQLDVNALKSQVTTFFSKINGNSKSCVGDLYNDGEPTKKAIIFCFDSIEDVQIFGSLFNYVNAKDLNDGSSTYVISTDQTFEIFLTDGHDELLAKNITFKVDGLYEKEKLLLRYDTLETFDGKKCNIVQNLPIVPIRFLEVDILHNKCVSKLKYNKIDTYIGSNHKDCINIFKYVNSKMFTNCNNMKNGPMNKYQLEQISRPQEGSWTGWIHYHKILDNGGAIDENPYKIQINKEIIEVYDNTTILKQKIDYKNITWPCNDDGDCNIPEFIIYLDRTKQINKLKDFFTVITQIGEKWKLQDYNHCFVIEENDIHIVCVIDYSEEYAIRLAFSAAMDYNLMDAPADTFLPFKNNTQYKVIMTSDSNIYFEDHILTIFPEKAVNANGQTVIEFKKIKPLSNIECGFEFRHISLPSNYHEINPLCCTRFYTDENNYLCIPNSKCYLTVRRLAQLLRTNCLFENGMKSNLTNPIPANPLKPDVGNITKRAWAGEVIFNDVDNYKYKGDAFPQKGYLNIDTNFITYTLNSTVVYNFSLITADLLCDSSLPCLPAEYEKTQEPFLMKNYDKEWSKASFQKFWQTNKDINQRDCMVLVAQDVDWEISFNVLTCTTAPDQGLSMRQAVTDIYSAKIEKMNGTEKEFSTIPIAGENKEFDVSIISTSNSTHLAKAQVAKTTIKLVNDGITYKASGEYVFNYIQLIDLKTNATSISWAINSTDFPISLKKENAIEKCCFKVTTPTSQVFYICTNNPVKCVYDKATLFRTIQFKADKFLSIYYANDKRRRALNMMKLDDPFDFGLSPLYKYFPKEFNLDLLNADTYDNSRNGHWEGWVYEMAMTERNYNKIVTPVYCQIADGFIKFKIDQDKEPYKILHLHQYEQKCSSHCQPKEYIELRAKASKNYDDIMYLKKAVNNFMGQMKNAFIEEGCVLLDFVSPIYMFGHSDMICTVDKSHGDKIRNAIDNSYYVDLLDLDIVTQVRKPNYETDQYYGKLVINNKLVESFNKFWVDKNGLVGKKLSLDPTNTNPITKDVFNITYNNIGPDNYGNNCAFWFKNLRVKQREPELEKNIADNNCCFRFFTKSDRKKVEICTFNVDGRICIKQSRELMKGIKNGCEVANKYSIDTGTKNPEQTDESVDLYLTKTIDDHNNGVFDGFVYFGHAFESSQALKLNPFYIKINKDTVGLFDDHNNLEKHSLIINVPQIEFSCDGYAPCKPDAFLKYAKTNPAYMDGVSSLETVYNMYKDTFSFTEDFNDRCFVIESGVGVFIACAYYPEQIKAMKDSIVQAYILNHSCKKISTVPDSDPSTVYRVVESLAGKEIQDEIYVNLKGVYSNITNDLVLDYRKIDDDPITKKKCAVWYKEVQISFPFDHPECCFALSVSGTIGTMCVQSEKVCVGQAFKLMKTIWNGCMYNSPSQNKIEPSPDGETLGQKDFKTKIGYNFTKERYDVITMDRNRTIFNSDNIHSDYIVDVYNDIAHSMNKTVYKGWFNVYPIDIAEEANWQVLKYYGELTPESFKFYENFHERKTPKLVVRPDMLGMSCPKGEACKPFSFIGSLLDYNPNLTYLKKVLESKLDLFEMKKEDGCAILENIVAHIPNYFMVCVHIKKIKSQNKNLQRMIDADYPFYIRSRQMLSTYYGQFLRKVVYDSYLISRKYLTQDILPVHDLEARQARISMILTKNDYSRVKISDMGIVAGSSLIVKFEDLQHCRVRVNPVYVPDDMILDRKQQCCMRFTGPSNQEYACLRDLNCEYSVFEFAKRFVEKCTERKNRPADDVFNELNTGNNVNALTTIRQVFKSEVKYTNIKALNPTEKFSTHEYLTKQKTLAIKFIFKIKNVLHDVNVLEIIKGKKLNTSPNDTTPPDPPTNIIPGVSARYTAESERYKIIAGKARVTKYSHKKDAEELVIMANNQFIKTKEFSAVILDKSKYWLFLYNGGNTIMQISDKGMLVTNSAADLDDTYKSKLLF